MADSVQEAVRIPSTLVHFIDVNFVNEGLFSSRADFISSAIRYYYENSVFMFGRYAKYVREKKAENDPLTTGLKMKTTLSVVKTMFMNTVYVNNAAAFDGEKVTVMCRLPPTLVRAYTRFINETGLFKSKTDFYNKAIGAYLDTQYYVDRITNSIHRRDAFLIDALVKDKAYGNTFNIESLTPINEDWTYYSVKDTEKEDWLDE